MRAYELFESRGVTARQAGETYTSVSNQDDILTFQDVITIPQDSDAYESVDDLNDAIDSIIPKAATRIDDNKATNSTLAAIIATVVDKNNNQQYWVRYIRRIPPQGVHTLWQTLRGYKYTQGAEKESLAIKPSDLITDEGFRTTEQLAKEIISGTQKLATESNAPELATVIETAVKLARTGQISPIKNAGQYFNVLQKYGGEYLGPLAIIDGGFKGGDTVKMLDAFGITTLKGSKVSFPQDVAMELIDSVLLTPDQQTIQISSKISTAGGAASSLSGVVKQLTPDIEERFPRGAKIMKMLGTKSAVEGPLEVALMLNIITPSDINAYKKLDKASQDINDLTSDNLIKLTKEQGISNDPKKVKDYRVFFHTLTAIMYNVMRIVNEDDEFKGAMMAALNNNNYVQVVTKGKQQGDDVSLDYFTKFPAVFKGHPQLTNKSYFASGQKGRIGFKLK